MRPAQERAGIRGTKSAADRSPVLRVRSPGPHPLGCGPGAILFFDDTILIHGREPTLNKRTSASKGKGDDKITPATARRGDGPGSPGWASGLRQLYDSVVDEPLPDTFKDLLSKLDSKN
ncbi:NepR family anti-sigma factor [Tsuneonella sp. SYSU-LHT278]|uniref:NepR family anti-sigma factor n=1 Tax=Tsuneonella sediminis TaxID=3416089 RepID=UPI003F7A47CF